MRVLELDQGNDAWLEARSKHHCASDAAAMMGDSRYKTREDFLKEKATGIEPDHSGSEYIFRKGHKAEAKARVRPMAEAILDTELFPITATDDEGWLLASLDGITMAGNVIWEHKLLSESLADDIQHNTLDMHYKWQMEQQLLITGAEKCLFMCSDGTPENMFYMFYVSNPALRAALIDGWKQFEQDLTEWVNPERTDEAFRQAALDYELALLAFKEAKAEEERAKDALIALCGTAAKTEGFGVTVKRTSVKGRVDYTAIPELEAVDLDAYRKSPTEKIKIVIPT